MREGETKANLVPRNKTHHFAVFKLHARVHLLELGHNFLDGTVEVVVMITVGANEGCEDRVLAGWAQRRQNAF
jgi:hypothetical protein